MQSENGNSEETIISLRVFVIFVTECYKVVSNGFKSIIRDGGLVSISSKIFDHILRSGERTFSVNDPFFTIKRGWCYDYTLVKTLPKVAGEFGIIFTVYNLRRAITILGMKELLKRLKKASLCYISLFLTKLEAICAMILFKEKKLFLN